MKKTIAGALSGLASAAMLLPSTTLPAQAGIGEELTIAQTQALFAYRSGGRGVGGAVIRLQSVLNCLVGPGGEGYNVATPNSDPCVSAGKGAIHDAVNAAQKKDIEEAIALTRKSMTITEPEAMQEAATNLADLLGKAKEHQ